MKILELTTFTAGICGVGARVLQESQLLAEKGHEVQIFSTNFTKGSKEIASSEETIGKVKVTRFPAKRLGGESYTRWNFIQKAIEFNPEVIIAHAYRHTHTTKALKISKMLNARVFLVTHAPFVPGNSTRSFLAKQAVNFYDYFIGPNSIKKFNKVIAITKWEIPFLEKLGLEKDKIAYVPNGISPIFFTTKKSKEKNTILFVGRVSPIKDLETLIRAFHLAKIPGYTLEIVGPAENDYLNKLNSIINKENIENVIFSGPIFDKTTLVEKIDESKIFVLPSKREAMPQALIEAMARGKIVIASDNLGTRDLIVDGKNGIIFPVGDINALAKALEHAVKSKSSNISNSAISTASNFKWEKVIELLEKVIS